LRNHAEPREHMSAHPADAELQALEVLDRVDLLTEPAAHLGAGVAHHDAVDIELAERLVDDLPTATEVPPGVLVTRIEAEGQAGAESKRRLLADVEIDRRLSTFDGPHRDRIECLQPGDDLAG